MIGLITRKTNISPKLAMIFQKILNGASLLQFVEDNKSLFRNARLFCQ